MRKLILLAALLFLVAASAAAETQYAAGVVFHDANRNCVRDRGERGIPGVRVSNSRTIVRTDAAGSYRLPITDDTIIFVIKPRNWMPLVDADNVPRFYYIHKPNGSPQLEYKGVDPTGPLPESVDFPLYPNPEPDRFHAVFIGDTQVGSDKETEYLARDIIAELIGTDAHFAVSLGDIVSDKLSLFEHVAPIMGKMGIPCYYVKGNHDSNYDGTHNYKLVDESFERVFGPSHYSFDYGPVHFITLNNPFFTQGTGYHGRLDLEQMAFLRNDLASIPKDQLVVLMMHIPIMEMKDREQIFALLQDHPNTFSIAGHTHKQHHHFLTREDGWKGKEPHHLFVNGTACGSWWTGWPDEVQIPHTTMRDGTPNGYSIVTFDGTSYSIAFKAARRPKDYQMNIYAPHIVDESEAGKTEVFVNVFAGSDRSKVEMRLGDKGDWIKMVRVSMADPAFVSAKELQDAANYSAVRQLPGSGHSDHIWKAFLPSNAEQGVQLLCVRTTDMFGQTYTANAVINVQ